MEIKDCIEKVINNTFEVIGDVYKPRKKKIPDSRIIFPKKVNGQEKETRVSEQELRFIFVEQLNKCIDEGWDVYYSVETPTLDKYSFKGDSPKRDKKGRSANFDLVIHDAKSFKSIALFEFKANNPKTHDYQKDFVKLTNEKEEGELRYFIQILEHSDGKTEENIKKKKVKRTKECGEEKVLVKCWSLEIKEKLKSDKEESAAGYIFNDYLPK